MGTRMPVLISPSLACESIKLPLSCTIVSTMAFYFMFNTVISYHYSYTIIIIFSAPDFGVIEYQLVIVIMIIYVLRASMRDFTSIRFLVSTLGRFL